MRSAIGGLVWVCIPTIVVASALFAAAPAVFAAPEGSSDVAGICRSVLGTEPGTSQHGACVDSLSHSRRGLSEARASAEARRACGASGLAANDPAFDRCVVRRLRDARNDKDIVRVRMPSGRPAAPYSHVSPSEVRYRERLACASLGLDPDTQSFASCVAGLDAALFGADHPMN